MTSADNCKQQRWRGSTSLSEDASQQAFIDSSLCECFSQQFDQTTDLTHRCFGWFKAKRSPSHFNHWNTKTDVCDNSIPIDMLVAVSADGALALVVSPVTNRVIRAGNCISAMGLQYYLFNLLLGEVEAVAVARDRFFLDSWRTAGYFVAYWPGIPHRTGKLNKLHKAKVGIWCARLAHLRSNSEGPNWEITHFPISLERLFHIFVHSDHHCEDRICLGLLCNGGHFSWAHSLLN